jgi:hypothetical protein
MAMFQLINSILHQFRNCFKREKTWRWFVVLVIGFMLRSDHRGITSIVSSLRLKPGLYHTILHFFRSIAYTTKGLYAKWIKVAIKHGGIERIGGRVVVLGDHSNESKEGLYMPGVQILHQDSQNSGKPEFISGHRYAHVSAVITKGSVMRSLPLKTELQESPLKEDAGNKESLVAQMIGLIDEVAQSIDEPVIAALDAYFCSSVALDAADKTMMESGERRVEIVTRAKTTTVAFEVPEPPKVKKRGQPRKYGSKIALYSLFSNTSKFQETTMVLYGKKTRVRYLCLDLIWRPVKRLVRFVLVEMDRGRCIFMSSSLTLTPEEIITIYALRFKIETSFAEQKHDVGCFAYHFWTTAMPKRKKRKRAEEPTDVSQKQKVAGTRAATESFVCVSTIATGILTLIAFDHSQEIWSRYSGWLRTRRSSLPTISTVKSALAQDFHASLPQISHLPSFSFIELLLRHADFLYEMVA